jgi:tryptophanyl-tRNA synthetase
LYTGRGPSAGSMHLGHLVPFKLTRYLQQALNCIVVIQMSDDEKFFFKDGTGVIDLETYRKNSYTNAKDIIACGFDVNKTLIFSNLESNGGQLYFNNVLLMKCTTINNVKSIYGIGESLPGSVINLLSKELLIENAKETKDVSLITDLNSTIKKFSSGCSNNLGQCVWPAFQCGPAFCTSFKDMFTRAILSSLEKNLKNNNSVLEKVLTSLGTSGSNNEIMCLVPMAIDQAPYFRMARDSASILGCPKPAVIHSEFLPGLKQSHGKMSTTGDSENSTLFLNMKPDDVEKTIKSHAFSGGKDTAKDHKLYGGDIRIDICYQYLTYFMESDQELKEIARKYTSGEMGSGEIKKITADLVAKEITNHQLAITDLTETKVNEFFDWNRTLDIGGCDNRSDLSNLEELSDYDNYGINFDRTFGLKCKDVV